MGSGNLFVALGGLNLFLILTTCSAQSSIFQYCDNDYTLNPGYSYLESPYYPNYYPPNTACRYKFRAPIDHTIRITCSVETDFGTTQCSTENVYVSVEGDPVLRGSENFCGTGTFTRTSLFNNLVVAYISQGSWGKFQCEMFVEPQPCDCGWSANKRIINGEQAMINEFPFMVALRDRTSTQKSYCGGSIISHRYIMTAAHCAKIQEDPANVEILVGDHDLSSTSETLYADRYDVEQIIIHPYYIEEPQVINDIALMKTVLDIQWSRGVGPICIPPANMAYQDFVNQYVILSGWGTTSFGGATSTVLRKAMVTTTTNDYCQEQYAPDVTVYNSQICTASYQNKDACQYDSGGPVTLTTNRAFQLGVISFGKPCGTGSPSVGINTRITAYGWWLNQTTGYSLCSMPMY